MKLYRKFVFICLCFFLIALTTNIVYALTETHSVNISGVCQAKNNWCWAASAQMAGKCVYPSSTRTQYSIVNHLKGTDADSFPDVKGTISDSVDASEYMTFGNISFEGVERKWDFSEIAISLNRGYPVQAAAGYYTWFIRDGGHMVVIYMAQFDDNSNESNFYLSYYDPWDGVRHRCTYEAFCDASYNGRKYDGTVYVSQ